MEERRKMGRQYGDMYKDYLRRVIESDYPCESILTYEQWKVHMLRRAQDVKQMEFPKEIFWSKEVTAI